MIQGIRGIRSCSMENPTFEDIRYISLYSPYIRPCCELMRGTFHEYSPKKYEPGDICKLWCSKPVFQLQKYCDIIKICTFRPLLFVPHCDPSKKCHDPSCQFDELNLEKLCQIEILEDVTDIVKKFADDQLFISGILTTETDLEKGILRTSEVLEWMKYADHIGILQKLRKLADYCCWSILKLFFSAYKYYISKVILEDYNLVEAFESYYCDNCMMTSENMKKRGNEAFAKDKFDSAVTFYTKAIELWPENHFLYGNRALCFLRIGQYRKALCDGKRAIILNPCWPKGHYRFCDALSFLGEHRKALEANERGQDLCRDNPEGMKGLIEQHEKLKNQMEEARGIKQNKYRLKKQLLQKNSSEYVSVGNQESKKSHNENKKLCDSHHHPNQQKLPIIVGNTETRENRDHVSVFLAEVSENPQKQRSQNDDSEKLKEQLNLKTDSKKVVEKYNLQCGNVQQGDVILSLEMLKTYMKNGSTSLMDLCFHSAEQSFALSLNMIDPSQLQCLNLSLVDYVVIMYGYASALLGIGQPEELSKAKYHFDKIIEQYQKVRFNCLAHYGIGKVYLRQNRFSEALDQFMKSKTMVNLKIVPGVLTWPTTSVVIKETRSETLQVILEDCITECKFPPKPDAVCRYQQCQAHKVKIYFNDPDFKGFIRIACCKQCIVEFHLSCWKKVKATRYCDKNDKDILQEMCFTPDCSGLISKITVFSSSGIVKCEFEHKIITKNPPRPVLKQKCSSFRKLQVKQEKKLRRKFIKEAVSFRNLEVFNRSNVAKDDSFKGNIPKNFFVEDTILQLIGRYTMTIQDGVRDAFKLLIELLSWWVLSEEDYALFSTSCLSSAEIMDQLVSFLIAKNDRVKTRIFVHVVSEFEDVDPKLHDWMKHLDNNGLKATEFFLSEYITYILQIDFNSVAVLWNEKYGIKLSKTFTCLSEDAHEIIEYLEELSLTELRYLVWLLEENRQCFPFLHQCLDDYFDNLDNPFIVLKKEYTETTSNNAIKVKNKNRKKSKESKAILVVSGGVGTVTQEEDNIFSEENSLSFMNPHEPFRIPDDLHEQVMIFEALYNTASSNNSYQTILDNYPDPTCESLYDYFSQILEEHGPMEIDNPLLVGEYEDFPTDTRRIVDNAGGLKSFLLGSLRFVMVDDLIGLMKHAIMLQENTEIIEIDENNYSESLYCQENNFHSSSSLNPTAKEFKPVSFINKPYISTSTNNLEYVTTSHSSFSPFASSYSFSSQTTDTAPAANVSLSPTVSDNHTIFLNEIHSEYVNERLSPVFTQVPFMPDISEQTSYIYADYNAYFDTDSEATHSKGNADKFTTVDQVHTFQNNPCIAVKLDIHTCKDNLDQIEDHCCNDAECSSVTKMKTENKSARNNPRSRMIAIQVDQELTDAGVNTLPLHPYESQQGDMLRMEKEHHVLQKQLKEAIEKYEQLKCRSSKEISILEEELSLLIEGNKLSKRELDWFHQDAEVNFKKWQQEKKEKQEGLKAGKNKIRKLIETNETYMKNIDEKDKQYKSYLDEFLEISNRFECEKIKMEELIKKTQDYQQECVKRAIAAEVSVLENWKEKEFYKLCRKSTNAKANIKYLKFMTSHSAAPQSKLQIDSWESFISNIGEEKKKIESQFEERIYIVKNGALLNSITPVETAALQPPTGLSLATPEKSPINDPAIIMYSPAAPHLSAPFSNVNDNYSLSSKAKTHTGNKNPEPPSDKDIGELPSECRQSSLSDKVCLPQSLGNSGRHLQNIQQLHSILEEPAGAAELDYATILNKPILGKLSENIIDQLRIIFPYHTSSDLEKFIKEVNVKNRNKLSADDYLNRVTEFILDHPNTKKVLSSSRKNEGLSSCTSGENASHTQKVLNTLVQSKPKSKAANEKKNKTRLPSQSNQMPWKNIGETSKSKWRKSNDTIDNDPCVICHEELTSSLLHVLDCGHRFHKLCIGPWIKEHSTCPTCRRHILLREDYPELPGRNKKT
ncbi:E3 ubiquitin-protein ligase TTC3 isoform X2 [Pantherophis guttatus]|uniref:RING-type E3 ubiquitin transferase n=1 Tax=Pantherophis guttatus TaxID=94885 RepID=A0A6P9DPP7_PANGU|nr:E3 ubiquitin-protein ligase TTC3 isoform X2 [Pantherophis guttatus]